MAEAQSRQKSYTDTRRIDLSFEIVKKVGLVTYRVALPDYFGEVHDVFHVLTLKKCFGQQELRFVDPECIQLYPNLTYETASTQIVDWKEQRLRSKTIPLVKVSWDDPLAQYFSWEREADIREQYPYLFL
ncbi:hypothetical protein F2P56_022002 [Juglans regia]|uniref:Tf2-1-like SH3-like domain-containing protein n=2 Tax=Juglans regia TaxID=51240 RepID=A0A833X4G5_JUGRE|nr:uncharacterized protein LOC109020805 [Juglans regia]KAF5457931.1 hypothetical protein F2P56_022002 [Juglans regia]